MISRLGLFPALSINDPINNPDGSIRVLEEKCPTCPFRAGSPFGNQLKDIVGIIKTNQYGPMQCHNTYPSDVEGAACRGGFDYFYHDKIANPDFIEQPVSGYLVLPPEEYMR